jgi:hypothetical protein
LRECNHEHGRFGCRESVDITLPTRLVDCSNPQHPKLAESEGAKGAYFALSYVWGEAQPHMTTTRNIARRYHQGIDWLTLPQTIKDAIITTHTLDFRYLWTDSICIIQDSFEDKAREISQMDKIYNEASLTIVAESADKVSEGFLQDRRMPSDTFFDVRCPGKGTQIGKIYLSQWIQLDPPVISSRAWCFQEWLLSPRTLVFSLNGLEYHCYAHSVHVSNTTPHNPVSVRNRLPPTLFDMQTTKVLESHSLQQTWRMTVQDYTKRRMTNPADKLLAIAGIAKQFRNSSGTLSGYLAGLWEQRLLDDLTWNVPAQHDLEDLLWRPPVYRAPTWSWAAVDDPVRWQDAKMVSMCDIVRCDVALQDKSRPFGTVTAGSLVLRAPLVRAICMDIWAGVGNLKLLLSPVSMENLPAVVASSPTYRPELHNSELQERPLTWSLLWTEEGSASGAAAVGQYYPDCRDAISSRDIYAVVLRSEVPLQTGKCNVTAESWCSCIRRSSIWLSRACCSCTLSLDHHREYRVEGLLLYPSMLFDGRPLYRRVGYFEANFPWEWFQEALQHEVEII